MKETSKVKSLLLAFAASLLLVSGAEAIARVLDHLEAHS